TFERLYSLFLLVAVSVLLILLPRHGVFGWVVVGAGLVLATFAPLLFEMLPPKFERWVMARLARGRLLGRFAEGAQVMLEQFRLLMRAPVLLAATSAVTLVIFIAGGAQIWLVLDALGHLVPMTQGVASDQARRRQRGRGLHRLAHGGSPAGGRARGPRHRRPDARMPRAARRPDPQSRLRLGRGRAGVGGVQAGRGAPPRLQGRRAGGSPQP